MNFEEAINELNKEFDVLGEENNNYRSNTAKTALAKKLLGKENASAENIKNIKNRSILHHINGNHNDDADLVNDVLIVADDMEKAKLAHKILHLLSYCYIRDDLEKKLDELNVQFYYHPDDSGIAQPISLKILANGLVQHNKQLKDIALLDQDEEALDNLGHNNFRLNDALDKNPALKEGKKIKQYIHYDDNDFPDAYGDSAAELAAKLGIEPNTVRVALVRKNPHFAKVVYDEDDEFEDVEIPDYLEKELADARAEYKNY